MKGGQSSDTARGAIVIRAVHQLIDETPHILEDSISLVLLGDEGVREIRENAERYKSLSARALRSHVVLRSRYAEEELHRAVESGVTQFVNLGAGYDTFAFRQPCWARSLTIVEIDHPATQSSKIKTLERAGVHVPDNVAFVPLDLEKDTLDAGLAKAPLNPSLPTFVACLGVLAYLRPETARDVFRALAMMPKGSRLVFAFASPEGSASKAAPSIAERTATLGEPWLTRFDVEGLRSDLLTIGFREISFLDPRVASEKYYKGRHDLPAPRKIRLCHAVI